MKQGVFIGVAVKIVWCEKRAYNFGHRKRHAVRMSGVRIPSLRPRKPLWTKGLQGFFTFYNTFKNYNMRYVSHFTSGNFFVFEPVPYSLTYAVKFFTSVKRKGKANLRLIDALRLVSPLLPQLSLHGFLWTINSLSVVSRQPPASIPHNRYSIFLFLFLYLSYNILRRIKLLPQRR